MSNETRTHCANCDHRLSPWDKFCSQCGQDTLNHPPSLWEFVHEWVLHYVAVEGKLWTSLWALLAKPGFLTQEWLAGRKQRYVLPLRLLLTFGLLFFLALKLSPSGLADAVPQRERPEAAAKAASRAQAGKPQVGRPAETANAIGKGVGDNLEENERANATPAGPLAPVVMDAAEREKLPAWLRGPIERMEQRWSRNREVAFANFKGSLLALAPYAVLLSLPLFAGLLKLLYPGQVYGAHFLFAMHLHAAWYLMLLLLVLVPLAALPLWAWSNVYPLLALKRVNGSGWGSTLLRGAALALLHWMVIMLVVVVLVLIGAAAV